MSLYSFDGQGLKKMILGSTNLLALHKSEIDALNVFPVPDGDTGNNMYLTLLAAAKEIQELETVHIGEMAEAAARHALWVPGEILVSSFHNLCEVFPRRWLERNVPMPLRLWRPLKRVLNLLTRL
ncbi:hypothetical protein N752_03665 [Desulforamulus aquiferis]|nr:DAK2 domain-containing protein [Desulforamulus aquiferis]RYD06433.1 hypothetical protein N752_03665 [Desulforamulus aquiferis]